MTSAALSRGFLGFITIWSLSRLIDPWFLLFLLLRNLLLLLLLDTAVLLTSISANVVVEVEGEWVDLGVLSQDAELDRLLFVGLLITHEELLDQCLMSHDK